MGPAEAEPMVFKIAIPARGGTPQTDTAPAPRRPLPQI